MTAQEHNHVTQLPAEWEAAITKATSLLRQAARQAVEKGGHGEVAARIPFNGPKGPGREVAEYKETFV